MNEKALIKMEINIAGKGFPVKVSPDERLLVKNLEKEVNDKIREFQLTYSDISLKECISMALLSYAFQAKKNSSLKVLGSKLNSLEELLDSALN